MTAAVFAATSRCAPIILPRRDDRQPKRCAGRGGGDELVLADIRRVSARHGTLACSADVATRGSRNGPSGGESSGVRLGATP